MKTKIGLTEVEFPNLEGTLFDKGYKHICGVDEVGRGSLAGPVVAAAVMVPPEVEIIGCGDSKILTREEREAVFERIVTLNLPCGIGIIDNKVIDRINILKASLAAMRKAVLDLERKPEFLLIDGNQMVPNLDIPQFAIVSGDGRCQAIAAASIMAKVTRDRIMEKYEKIHPRFTFSQHKGYGTERHLIELQEHGPCDIHRRTYRPVAEIIYKQYALL